MTTNITYTNSACVAQFFSFKNQSFSKDIRVSDEGLNDGSFTISKRLSFSSPDSMETTQSTEDVFIISCNIARDKNLPASSFSMVVKSTRDLSEEISPGDWVMIYLDDKSNINTKDLKGLKTIGNVNRISRNDTTMEDGSVVRSYNIHGNGFGKGFSKTELVFNPYFEEKFKSAFLVSFLDKANGGPIDFLRYYLDIFLGDTKSRDYSEMLFQQLIPPSLYSALNASERKKGGEVCFADILQTEFFTNGNEGYILYLPQSNIMSVNLWQALILASNPELNELYTDVRDGKPTLVFRKKPLTKEIRSTYISDVKSDNKQIPLKYVVNSDLGKADHELFNYLVLMPSDGSLRALAFGLAQKYSSIFPQINKDSIKRFGLRKVELNTEYLLQKESNTLDESVFVKWMKELGDYWLNFHRFENGQIELIGKNDFKIGEFYRIPETGRIYMVEGVQYTWSYMNPIITTLSVTHGMKDDGNFIDETSKSSSVKKTSSLLSQKRGAEKPNVSRGTGYLKKS